MNLELLDPHTILVVIVSIIIGIYIGIWLFVCEKLNDNKQYLIEHQKRNAKLSEMLKHIFENKEC